MASTALFSPLDLREVTVRNRMGLAPMTQYCALDGHVTDWHLVHYGARSTGTGIVFVEATSVSATGAVTPHDLAIWGDQFLPGLRELARIIAARGAVPAIQLSHGGRKSSRTRPWDGDAMIDQAAGGWLIVGPTAEPFAAGYARPAALTIAGIEAIVYDYVAAARRAVDAGFRCVELHAGHGRLLHSFLSPLSNHREDRYGGSFENRVRLILEVVSAIRAEYPVELPLAVRLSCVDWIEGGWTIEDSTRLAAMLRSAGVDLIDCTSGGIRRPIVVPTAPGYQVHFAAAIRARAEIATAAVGLIDSAEQAERIIDAGQADLVLFGRAMLADPHLTLRFASQCDPKWGLQLLPPQYERGLRSLVSTASEQIPEL